MDNQGHAIVLPNGSVIPWEALKMDAEGPAGVCPSPVAVCLSVRPDRVDGWGPRPGGCTVCNGRHDNVQRRHTGGGVTRSASGTACNADAMRSRARPDRRI